MAVEYSEIDRLIKQFAVERDWEQFHTPRNLVLALVGEVGELAEVLQWKSDHETSSYLQTSEGRARISEELADVAIYLIRLCQILDLPFLTMIQEKIEVNAAKYPVEISRGNARKYTESG